MKIQPNSPERRRGRPLALGLLVAWGIGSLATLAYQQASGPHPGQKLASVRSTTK